MFAATTPHPAYVPQRRLQSVKKLTLVSLQEKNILFKQKNYHVLGLPSFGPFGWYDGGGGHVGTLYAM